MPKVIDLPTATSMDSDDYFLMEESSGGTKKIKKANANSVEQTTITAESGFTASINHVYKYGRVVQFIYWVTGTLSSGWNTVGTLPVGYRPIDSFDNIALDQMGSDPAADMKVSSAGNIQLYRLSTSSSEFRLTATFISAS